MRFGEKRGWDEIPQSWDYLGENTKIIVKKKDACKI